MTQLNEQHDNLPDGWSAFICKMQKVARATLGKSRHGLGVLSVSMIVNRDGEPVVWLDPDCRRIEPSANVAKVLLKSIVDSQTQLTSK